MTYEALLELIYNGITDDAAWTAALAMVATVVGASGAGLGVQDMTTHAFWAVAESGIDTGLHETYQRLAPENHIWQAISRAGRPLADQMVVPKSAFLRSALYAEWFVPQGFHSVMAAPVMASGSHSGVVVAFGNKQRGDFDHADLEQLGQLAGHLSRALALRLDRIRLVDELSARNESLERGGAMVFFCSMTSSAFSMPTRPVARCSIGETGSSFATVVSPAATGRMTANCERHFWQRRREASRRRRGGSLRDGGIAVRC